MDIEQYEEPALQVEDLNADVINKYKIAAEIANTVMAEIVATAGHGTNVAQLCALGDQMVHEKLSQVFNRGQVEKGPAYPTCISVNNCVNNMSPFDENSGFLSAGDVVKINLGVHLDGYIATLGHTHIIPGPDPSVPASGRPADVVCAAHFAGEAVLKMLRPGVKSTDITAVIEKVASSFDCTPIVDSYCSNMKRFITDGEKQFLNKHSDDVNPPEFDIEINDVYNIDILMSTGTGKSRELDARTTVYQRDVNKRYNLKLKASRYLLSEVNKHYPTMPFTIRGLDKQGLLGLKECVNHGLLIPYPVKYERENEYVAQIRFTVLVLPKGAERITSHALPYVHSLKSIEDPELNAILSGQF